MAELTPDPVAFSPGDVSDPAGRAAESDTARQAVPRRMFVPSEREIDRGLADYSFEPPPPPSSAAPEKVFALARVTDVLKQMDPRGLGTAGSRRALVLLTLVSLFAQWDDAAITLLLPEIRDHFNFDLSFLIMLGAALKIIQDATAPLMGYIADRVKRTRMLAFGALLANASSILAGFAPAVPVLILSRFGAGTGQALYDAPRYALVTDWFAPNLRARTIAYLGMATGAAGILGTVLAGVLGERIGFQWTIGGFGILAVAFSLPLFLLKEPTRGALDRKALGASDEAAENEQAPIGWAEGWRAMRSIATARRLWYAAPFTAAATQIMKPITAVYYADEFGLSPVARSWLFVAGALLGIVGLAFSGPMADRLLAVKPGRVLTLLAMIFVMDAFAMVVLAFSPFLGLSIAVGLPIMITEIMIIPAFLTLGAMITPPRLRGFGMQTTRLWQMLGQVVVFVAFSLISANSIRDVLMLLIPMYLISAWIISSASGLIDRDMRAALAASMADEEARRVREAGGNKMVICRDVDVTYGTTQVLFNVDFDVDDGEMVAILGTNGAGKSTLLRAIAGIQEASNGAIFLDGEDITHRPPYQNAEQGIVFMPGGRAVFPSLTVAENLRAAAWLYREDETYVRERTEEVLDFFPVLRDRLDQQAGTMSGGEQQMLALCQAFLMRPRLLMIDELSLGLAPSIVEQLLDIVRHINDQGTTVLLVEQSANVALFIAERAVFMDKGEIRFDGPTRELLGRGDLLRSVFLGGAGGGGGSPFIASGGGLMHKPRGEERLQVLSVEDVHLSYGGHRVLNGVSMEVLSEEVVGIIGPNGAGKTSLFDVISGYVPPDSGVVAIAGTDATGLGPDARARLGLTRSFQNARLFSTLTVRECIAVALEQNLTNKSTLAAALWLPPVRQSERRALRRVENLIGLLQLEAYADKFIDELSTGTRRMVDMAFVMATEPKLLLLDEPSSGLAQAEVEVLGPVVRRMAKESGCGVVVIEHDMPLIEALSDRLIAMELGSVLVEGAPADVVRHPRVVEAYLGASKAVIERSGSSLAEALATAGILGEPDGDKS